jgi:hypothetical protein
MVDQKPIKPFSLGRDWSNVAFLEIIKNYPIVTIHSDERAWSRFSSTSSAKRVNHEKWFHLLKGEVARLFKYKIMWFGSALSLIWVWSWSCRPKMKPKPEPFPYQDTGMMSIILLASSFYYEKQENTIKSLFVAQSPSPNY